MAGLILAPRRWNASIQRRLHSMPRAPQEYPHRNLVASTTYNVRQYGQMLSARMDSVSVRARTW
ncbi:hypothetical protein ANCDUO_05810 [Ancylostoma duodenale]|uniref:Uncharacterized protein n=1 Tax=Ancylostoma duodenale TaxID=51022 RepID=A0A0C2GRG6_9BILA|nr:hypothetical protein ANCDUO_05810 [Ancylostoma duodenale]